MNEPIVNPRVAAARRGSAGSVVAGSVAAGSVASRSVASRSRANGFVSAVLLVLLLATTGWPVETTAAAGGEAVACQMVGSARQVARAEEGAVCAARPRAAANTAARPRPGPRQRRIDCYGLPPPRAPTA